MPHSDETFYKMRCGWAEDPKVVTLARFGALDACLGRDLFSQMIDYARRELTDGLVPTRALAHIADPLPFEDALRIAGQLADPGTFGPLVAWDADSNATSNADSNAPGNALRILAYAKWNDTRAEVQARKQAGAKAARIRWDRADAEGTADSNALGNAKGHAEQEQEQDTPLPPATAQSRQHQGWTPSKVLEREARQPARRAGGPRTTHDTVAQVQADAHRPGGPAADPAAAADAARKAMANRQRQLPAGGQAQEPPAAQLHGEALARQQLETARAARLPDQLPSSPAEDEGVEPDDADPDEFPF